MSDSRDFVVELADLQRAMYPDEVAGAAVQPRCWGVHGEPWLPVQMEITPSKEWVPDLLELRVVLRRVATDGRETGTGEKKQCGRCGTTEDAIFDGCCFDCWITRAKDAEAALAALGRDARPHDEDGRTDAERRNVEADGQGDPQDEERPQVCRFGAPGCPGFPSPGTADRLCPACAVVYNRARRAGMPPSGRHG